MTREEHEEIKTLIDNGYLDINLRPLKCTKCESSNVSEAITDMQGGYPCESVASCGDCGQHLGYWCYGHWQA